MKKETKINKYLDDILNLYTTEEIPNTLSINDKSLISRAKFTALITNSFLDSQSTLTYKYL